MKIQLERASAVTIIAILLTGCGSASVSPSPVATTAPTAAPTVTVAPTPFVELTPTPTLCLVINPDGSQVQCGYATEAPTVAPTPTPVPLPTDDELIAACAAGTPIPEAAAYTGAVHPLVVVWASDENNQWIPDISGDTSGGLSYDIDSKWLDGSWPGPIQLVVCVGLDQNVKLDSCGTYQRQSNGVTGSVIRYKIGELVRIVVAATGKTLMSKTFYGTLPTCASEFDTPMMSGDPPWELDGDYPDIGAINTYATAASTQTVK